MSWTIAMVLLVMWVPVLISPGRRSNPHGADRVRQRTELP
jgi:hypothetical protein